MDIRWYYNRSLDVALNAITGVSGSEKVPQILVEDEAALERCRRLVKSNKLAGSGSHGLRPIAPHGVRKKKSYREAKAFGEVCRNQRSAINQSDSVACRK